jgi:murein L,D-transpeptidase YafK
MKARIVILSLIFAMPAQAKPLAKPLHADAILVEKSQRRLTLLWHGAAVKTYRVALGGASVGRKQCEGDDRTPEGVYRIDSRNAGSAYHRSLHVSYPNAADVAAARRRGCAPGGAVMIHGLPNGFGAIGSLHTARDWTKGCVAVTDAEIEEIWKAVPNGAAVEIRP